MTTIQDHADVADTTAIQDYADMANSHENSQVPENANGDSSRPQNLVHPLEDTLLEANVTNTTKPGAHESHTAKKQGGMDRLLRRARYAAVNAKVKRRERQVIPFMALS